MKRAFTAVLILALLLPLGGCAANTKPQLIRIDSAVFAATKGIYDTAVILGDNKILTPQQELAIQQKILPVAQLGEAATMALSAWSSGATPPVLCDLVRALGELTQTIITMLETNPQAKASLLEKVAVAQQAVLAIISIMGGQL